MKESKGNGGERSPAELLLSSVQRLVDSERRLRELEVERAQINASYRELAQEVQRMAAATAVGKVIASVMPGADRVDRVDRVDQVVSIRDRIHSMVSHYIEAHELNEEEAQAVWMELYRVFRLRHGRDLAHRARNRGTTGLDIAEELDRTCRPGSLDDLYAIAHDRCGPSGVFIF